MKKFNNPELIPVGEIIGDWAEIKCPYCDTINWVNGHGEVADVVNCRKCSKYFWLVGCLKEFFCDKKNSHIEIRTVYGKEKPDIKKHGRPNGMNILTYTWYVWFLNICPCCKKGLSCSGANAEVEYCTSCGWKEL
jgi:hypothetical protein